MLFFGAGLHIQPLGVALHLGHLLQGCGGGKAGADPVSPDPPPPLLEKILIQSKWLDPPPPPPPPFFLKKIPWICARFWGSPDYASVAHSML